MARIVGGIGTSHAPSIAHAYDRKHQHEPLWKPLFDGFEPAKAWLSEVRPDLMIMIYNDHMNRFFFDAYPTFALGVGELHEMADEGWGKRDFPPLPGHAEFGWHLARSLVADEFDPTICQEISIDHGILSILPLLCDPPWPMPIVPLAVNVIQHPLPSARRCYRLGEAIRRAAERYPDDLRIVIVGTGGMSHQLHGERFGFLNPDWDMEFLQKLESEPQALTALTHDDYMERGGAESVELIMWLTMRAALTPQVTRVHRMYYAPMITGYGLVVFEPQG
jgi:protocatechuate 4,5-dioxygenase, beta chain